jgi:hypothetical protein
MKDFVWLASYPKSGNTWMRILLSGLTLAEGKGIDINALDGGGLASSRGAFDNQLMIDSGLLTFEEIDRMRPILYTMLAEDEDLSPVSKAVPIRFVKVHDAYTRLPGGEPLLAGDRAAKGAIVIVRDPRAVAPSLANHMRSTPDDAVTFMDNPKAAFAAREDRITPQLRQKLLRWSDHVSSWLDQPDIPVHLLRYEDLKADTAAALGSALRFAGLDPEPEALRRAVALADFEKLQAQERESGFAEWIDKSGKGRVFFRSGQAESWRSELTAEQRARIERAHGAMMRRLGYLPDGS